MTNINQVNESAQSYSAEKNPGKKTQKADAFQQALIDALDKPEPSEMGNMLASPLGEIASKELSFTGDSSTVSGKTDQLLQMLDLYSAQLEDPNIPLKKIAPVVKQIKEDAGELLKETQSLSKTDEALKRIAQETAVTAHTEYFKFQRGDYLS
ncbi:MAG: hypothetical protein GY729_16915 [Desulfobacteraceae bacterium]|nr:hypothetical protein [Desulfobacteraceae bacterium]